MRKFFVSLLTLVSIYSASPRAQAAWDIFNWGKPAPLTLEEACAQAMTDSAPPNFLSHTMKEFLIYKQNRTKVIGRKLAAPMKPIFVETTLFDIFYGFKYWWVPGNEWHALMMADQGERGLKMLADTLASGVRIPGILEKPVLAQKLNVPDSLPPVRAPEQTE